MKLKVLSVIISAALLVAASCGEETKQDAQAPASSKTASGLASIVPEGAKMEKLSIDYEFDTAGLPCWSDGELYFTNNIFDPSENSKTMKIDTEGLLRIVRGDNGVTTCSYNTGKGTFYCCEMVGHRVVEMDKNGRIVRTVATVYGGTRLDGPNDLTIDSKGGIYFTDSHFSPGEDLKQDGPMVLYVTPDGKVVMVADDIEFPNGLELSPDGSTLYVVNTKGADKGRAIYAYDVQADGSLSNKRTFAELQLTPANESKADGVSGADGTAVDTAGNFYVATTQGLGIQVFDKSGTHMGNIPCPSVCNNLSFGGTDMKTLYVSAKDGVYKLDLLIAGKNPPM